MREDVRLRVMQAAEHILETGATVRACAAKYGVSKTTIHKDMRARLPHLDSELFKEVDAILKKNLEERHIRGGAATREKFRRSKPPPLRAIKRAAAERFHSAAAPVFLLQNRIIARFLLTRGALRRFIEVSKGDHPLWQGFLRDRVP